MSSAETFYPACRALNVVFKRFRLFILISVCLCAAVVTVYLDFRWSIKRRQPKTTSALHLFRKQCEEKQSVVFVKVHKTGGTTISNILQRFGSERTLNFALPNKTKGDLRYNYFGGIGDTLKKDYIASLMNGGEYDILCHHVIFNDLAFDNVFNSNASYITLVRDPLQQFLSSLLYYNFNEKLFEIATKNITEYLSNPHNYEDDNPYYSFTNNRQSLDLGLNPNILHDEELIDEYLYVLDIRFNLVMITEYFDESLIMLKRQMCWELKDLLYMRKNSGYRKFDFELSSHDINLFRRWQVADYLVYRHFLKTFLIRMKKEKYLVEEVHHFREILRKMNIFCNSTEFSEPLIIESSPWNSEFTISNIQCAYMRLSEISFLEKLHQDRMRPHS